MTTATHKTGMVSGAQARKMELWLSLNCEDASLESNDKIMYDVTERMLAKYPALRRVDRVASFLEVLISGEILVYWTDL